jgi:hypothetical protein
VEQTGRMRVLGRRMKDRPFTAAVSLVLPLLAVDAVSYWWGHVSGWGGWEWPGWVVFVAMGTVALAAGTAWLAWSTRRLVAQTKRDVEAQWIPVILPGEGPIEQHRGNYWIPIQNVGRGPALKGYVRWSDQTPWNGPFNLGPNAGRDIFIVHGGLGPIKPNSSQQFVIEYESIAGTAAYQSRFLIALDQQEGREANLGKRGLIHRIADVDYEQMAERAGPGPLNATNRLRDE